MFLISFFSIELMLRRKFYSNPEVLNEDFDLEKSKERILDFRKKTVESYLNEGWIFGGSGGNYYLVSPNLKKKISIWDDFEVEDVFKEIYSKIDSQIKSDLNTEFEYEFNREEIWEREGYKGISQELNITKGLARLLRKIPENVRECLVNSYKKFRF